MPEKTSGTHRGISVVRGSAVLSNELATTVRAEKALSFMIQQERRFTVRTWNVCRIAQSFFKELVGDVIFQEIIHQRARLPSVPYLKQAPHQKSHNHGQSITQHEPLKKILEIFRHSSPPFFYPSFVLPGAVLAVSWAETAVFGHSITMFKKHPAADLGKSERAFPLKPISRSTKERSRPVAATPETRPRDE